jgi:endonuclease/exonuclease/phosphatase (EEP) superfamily protein YafD
MQFFKDSQQTSKIIFSGLMVLPALIVLFAPAIYSFKWLVDYTVQVMLAYLAGGFIFLIFSSNYWLSLSWGCCVFLCIFLKYTSNKAFSFDPPTGGKIIKVSNYNISFVEDSIEYLVRSIQENNADLVSIQEVTPNLDTFLILKLKEKYPNHYSLKRADYYGMLIFSNYPFENVDTFNLTINGIKNGFHFIVSYCPPSFSNSTYQLVRDQLKAIANEAKKIDGPIITMGTYNSVPWAPEIQDFKKIASLNDSRLGFTPSTSSSSYPLFQIPIDHIFHSNLLKCTNFRALGYHRFAHLGVEGTFEVTP